MLLQDSRRDARVDAHGDIVLLEEQDRSRWDREAHRRRPGARAARARARLHRDRTRCRPRSRRSTRRRAKSAATDWPQIAALYGVLSRVAPSPVVELNRAVAVAMAEGPAAGLSILEALRAGGGLQDHHLFHAARADLLGRLGRTAEAREAYEQSLSLVTNEPERRLLERKRSAL